jgi:hypothetical protein
MLVGLAGAAAAPAPPTLESFLDDARAGTTVPSVLPVNALGCASAHAKSDRDTSAKNADWVERGYVMQIASELSSFELLLDGLTQPNPCVSST